jgi:ubiquitin carboxyl-terminal hydrolase 5/13
MSEIKSLIEKYSTSAKIANEHDKVYKDECMFSFDTSESEQGLFVCLNKFIGVSKKYLPIYYDKTKSHLYLKIKTLRREVYHFLF